MVVIAIFRVIKAPFIDENLSIIDCYAEAVHVFRNFVHVIKNRLAGAPVHVIEKTVHVHENCCSRVLRILTPRDEGTPQGSPLSPILSLIVLDELDKYLEKRGLKFCRYADDCNIYVGSERAERRVLENTIKFIEETLKLRVNRNKSGVFRPRGAKFLGYTFVGTTGQPLVHPKSFKRLQDKPRTVFYRARGGSLFRTIRVLNAILRGWRQYFKLDTRKGVFEELDIHILKVVERPHETLLGVGLSN